MGALSAEGRDGEVWTDGSNIAALWELDRQAAELPPLVVTHCAAHRGSLAYKATIDEWLDSWQKLLNRQWFFFSESGAAKSELM